MGYWIGGFCGVAVKMVPCVDCNAFPDDCGRWGSQVFFTISTRRRRLDAVDTAQWKPRLALNT